MSRKPSLRSDETERQRKMLRSYATRFEPDRRFRTLRIGNAHYVRYSPTLGDVHSCDLAEENIAAAIADYKREFDQ